MAIDAYVDSTALDAALTQTANAIRAKTGDTAQIPFDMTTQTGFKDAIEAIPSGSEVYFSNQGQMYTKQTIIPNSMRYVRDHYSNAVNLEYFEQKNGSPALDSDYGLFSGCSKLTYCWCSRTTFGLYCFRDCGRIKTLILGREGLAVTSANAGLVGGLTNTGIDVDVTIYVDATSISGVSSNVSRIIDRSQFTGTLTYRNSTTGEVLTE